MSSTSALECIECANRLLCRSTLDHRFVTFFLGILDPVEHRLEFGNAGHNPPLLIAGNGHVSWLESGGPVLGVIEDASYEGGTVSLGDGDLLVTYSDGITEANSPAGELYGEKRLIGSLKTSQGQTAGEIQDSVLEDLQHFVGEAPRSDDIALVVILKE